MTAATAPILVTCMKNEGIFLLEWVAYHRAIGFDAITINTHECSDGTDLICDHLAELGLIEHVRNEVPTGANAQRNALENLLKRPDIHARDWLLHIAADEFLAISVGEGKLNDLLETMPKTADVLALHWRSLGNGQDLEWSPSMVIENWTGSRPKPPVRLDRHKSMFKPSKFQSAIDHMPKKPTTTNIEIVNSAGQILPSHSVHHAVRESYRAGPEKATWQNASIHHYALKTQDVFRLKGMRDSGAGTVDQKYAIGGKLWQRNRGGGTKCDTALRHLTETKDVLADMRADQTLSQLEKAAQGWFIARRDQMYKQDRINAETTTEGNHHG
ncbi:Glycosyl transferase family 2 [Monaibacterium marinum]|uniref:Glycosyl transferase family 2 n=1 Tax=Pontivivens marinum TaxID=1690039 RepID=A0A2C9CN59_9RHOB|nr:glycosyltransferase family 2 protein [Monaibacterium marinum]SOH92630.1 Glycosyl transferase family 2 [Monaibacterium marinum]